MIFTKPILIKPSGRGQLKEVKTYAGQQVISNLENRGYKVIRHWNNDPSAGCQLMSIDEWKHIVLVFRGEEYDTPFVVWRYDEEGLTYSGFYTDDYKEALNNFNNR